MEHEITPNYKEMLKMNSEDFRTWVIKRSSTDLRSVLIEEMVEHEEETKSFTKTARENISEGEQAALNVFSRSKSTETIRLLEKMNDFLDVVDKRDLIMESIFAKATSDHARLGK